MCVCVVYNKQAMAKLVFSCAVYLSAAVSIVTTASFFHQGNDIKCCNPNDILSSYKNGERISLKCKYDENKSLTIVTAAFQRKFPHGACVDVLEKINGDKNVVRIENVNTWTLTPLNLTYLPKCCPINYSYDRLKHRCVESTLLKISRKYINQHLAKGFVIVKAGMGECRSVITDHEFSSLHEILTNLDDRLSLNVFNHNVLHGHYCFDEAHNSKNFVVRICQKDLNSCRVRKNDSSKVKCIRKCCPDGKLYTNKKCRDNLYQGFNFFNNTRLNTPKEPFAIIVPRHECHKFMSDDSDEYYIDEKGHIRFTVEDNPPLYYSPFKESYCFENVKLDKKMSAMRLFVCLRKGIDIPSNIEDD